MEKEVRYEEETKLWSLVFIPMDKDEFCTDYDNIVLGTFETEEQANEAMCDVLNYFKVSGPNPQSPGQTNIEIKHG